MRLGGWQVADDAEVLLVGHVDPGSCGIEAREGVWLSGAWVETLTLDGPETLALDESETLFSALVHLEVLVANAGEAAGEAAFEFVEAGVVVHASVGLAAAVVVVVVVVVVGALEIVVGVVVAVGFEVKAAVGWPVVTGHFAFAGGVTEVCVCVVH